MQKHRPTSLRWLLGILVLGLLQWSPVVARQSYHHFERFSMADELPDYSIMALHQDSKGFIWIGTQNGLARFEGNRFKSFMPDPTDSLSLSDGFIYALAEDQNAQLWIGTRSGGLAKYDPKTESFKAFDELSNRNKVGGVSAIHIDRSGYLWLAAIDGGLYGFDPISEQFKDFNLVFSQNGSQKILTFSKEASSSNLLWLGTENGLFSFDLETYQITRFQSLRGDSLKMVRSIVAGDEGNIWIGSEGGLYRGRMAGTSLSIEPVEASSSTDVFRFAIDTIVRDDRGLLWVGTRSNGLYSYNPANGNIRRYTNQLNAPYTLSDNYVRTLLLDSTGMLWIGAFSGLNKYNPAQAAIQYFYDELPNLDVQAFAEDREGTIWIGTGAGLAKFDPAKTAITSSSSDSQYDLGSIHALTLTPDSSHMWVGSDNNSLFSINLITESVETFLLDFPDRIAPINEITAILSSRLDPSILWIGTQNSGLYRYIISRPILYWTTSSQILSILQRA